MVMFLSGHVCVPDECRAELPAFDSLPQIFFAADFLRKVDDAQPHCPALPLARMSNAS
nr:hypothetical protein [Mesorhizobium sp.]